VPPKELVFENGSNAQKWGTMLIFASFSPLPFYTFLSLPQPISKNKIIYSA
jgi:hypothetical protein